MTESDINSLLKKSEELKALFILGQRVIPFLEEIFIFVREIKPILDDINVSIQDNLKKMPNASKQLSKVTEATEMATNEIMDIVDGLIYKSDQIDDNLNKLRNLGAGHSAGPMRILELIQDAVKNDTDTDSLLGEIKTTIEDYRNNGGGSFDDIIKQSGDLVNSIRMDSDSIMMSLQVQDITSQQIAAVNHLLETIQHKLDNIMKRFKTNEISELTQKTVDKYNDKTNVSKMHRDIAFDPEAVESIILKETRQSEIDDLIEKQRSGDFDIDDDQSVEEDDMSTATQDDIDALFSDSLDSGSGDLAHEAENESTDEISPEETSDDELNEEISQDDIDAMFS